MAFRKLFFKRVQGIRDNYLLQEGDIALDESDFQLYRGDGSTTGGIRISNDSATSDIVNDTTPQLGGNLESNGNNIKMADNDKLLFGDSDDLEVFHNGSHSFIKDSGTGSLKLLSNNFNVRNVADTEHGITFTSGGAVELYHNGTKKFETASTGATVTGIFNIGDGSVSDNYIGLGAANDLKIFHNGSHSIIRETGTGSLYVQSDNNVILGSDSGTETYVKGIYNGSVELYHNNVKKFDTGSHGVDIVDEAHIEGATPHLTIKRTDNANVPTVRFKGSGGTVGATIEFDGTSGTANELIFKTFPGLTLTERFRVTYTGASVLGNLQMGESNTNTTITTNGTGDLTLNTNGGTDSGFIEIKDGNNANITVDTAGNGDILLKTDGSAGRLGIGTVGNPDTAVHVKSAASIVTLQRTDDANTPGLSFQNSNGNVRATIKMDGTSGTSKELVFQTHDSSLSERFRVTLSGSKVTGNLEVTGAQIDFTALPTSDPGVAGRLFRSGNDVKISTG
ncbi:MAG: hypothetical protein CMF52_05745 [Legionellales bacterium]|nr:hypothetical protein [Legionellales bacterium]